MRDASDRASDVRARLQRAEARRRHLHQEFHPADAAHGLVKIEAELEALRAELSDADSRQSEAAAAFAAAAACHDTARKFAHEQGLPMPSADSTEMGERRGLVAEEGTK